MGNRRLVSTRVDFMRQSVEWEWVLAEVGDIENRIRVGEVKSCQICIYACIWGPEIWDASGSADTSTGLVMILAYTYIMENRKLVMVQAHYDYNLFCPTLIDEVRNGHHRSGSKSTRRRMLIY